MNVFDFQGDEILVQVVIKIIFKLRDQSHISMFQEHVPIPWSAYSSLLNVITVATILLELIEHMCQI